MCGARSGARLGAARARVHDVRAGVGGAVRSPGGGGLPRGRAAHCGGCAAPLPHLRVLGVGGGANCCCRCLFALRAPPRRLPLPPRARAQLLRRARRRRAGR
eukprot:3172247-Rhodomonas_salina.1